MTKRTKPRKRRNKPPRLSRTKAAEQQSDTHQQNSLARISARRNFGLAFLGIFLTVVFGGPVFFSRVGIGSQEVDASLPFSASFPVSNQGVFNVYSVYHACHVNELTAGEYHIRNSTNGDLSASRTLTPGAVSDVTCLLHTGGNPVRSADIDIVAYYRPQFSPVIRSTCAKFTLDSKLSSRPTWRQSPGKNCRDIWVPEPLRKTLTLPQFPALWLW